MPAMQDDCTDAGGTHPWMDAVEPRREQAVESNAGAVAEQLQALPKIKGHRDRRKSLFGEAEACYASEVRQAASGIQPPHDPGSNRARKLKTPRRDRAAGAVADGLREHRRIHRAC